MNRKIKIVLSTILLLFIIVIVALYISQENFRKWIDINILRKNVTQKDVAIIDLDTEKSNQVYIYNKYVALLNNQVVTLYNNFGEKVTDINVNINNGIFDANEKYFVIAEKNGREFCLILDKTYLWSDKIDGEILQIHVNRNGYVALVAKDTTYKSILILYNSEGKQLFKSYFSHTSILDVSISNDNQYFAIAEIDSSGILIKSNIKILSVEDAKKGDEKYIFTEQSDNIITNVKYQSKNKVVCMYDNSIKVIDNGESKEIFKIKEKGTSFMSVELSNCVVYIEEETKGVFKTNSFVNIKNTKDNKIYTYNVEETIKGLYTRDNIIAINVGTEIYFLNNNGWLVKKYVANQEISNVLFSKHLAGIIYKDKVLIINL